MKKFWIVVRVPNGTFEAKRPAVVASVNPWPHQDYIAACEEASRLSRTHNATFVVMESTLKAVPVVSSATVDIVS